MKKFLVIFVLFFSFLVSKADVTGKIDSTVKAVDTSSTFKMVYNDIKQSLQGLGEALKVGAEHVYEVMVRQQVVYAITWSIYCLLCIPIIFFIVKGMRWSWEKDKPEGHYDDRFGSIFAIIFGCVGSIILIIIAIKHVDVIVTGFVNPEYGAMKDIMEFIKK